MWFTVLSDEMKCKKHGQHSQKRTLTHELFVRGYLSIVVDVCEDGEERLRKKIVANLAPAQVLPLM